MPGVMLGYCSPLQLSARFASSLTALIDHDRGGNGYLAGQVSLLSGPRVAEARSQIVDAFGQHPAKPDWLLMLDSDMVFDPDLVDRLMDTADPDNVPFLGALCFAGVQGGKTYPTIYRAWNEDDGHLAVEPVDEYPQDALVRVGATGAACTLVHRRVFAACRRPGPGPGVAFDAKVHGFGTLTNGKENPFPWYSEGLTTSNGIALGEDIAFCRRLLMLGIPMHVHTGIQVGHEKSWVIGAADHDTFVRERDRPGPLLDAALAVLKESGRFGPDELHSIGRYLAPRPSILRDVDRPKPAPFLLPEPEPVG